MRRTVMGLTSVYLLRLVYDLGRLRGMREASTIVREAMLSSGLRAVR